MRGGVRGSSCRLAAGEGVLARGEPGAETTFAEMDGDLETGEGGVASPGGGGAGTTVGAVARHKGRVPVGGIVLDRAQVVRAARRSTT